MSIKEYFIHYITPPESLIFFAIALASVTAVEFILYLCALIGAGKKASESIDEEHKTPSAYKAAWELGKRRCIAERLKNYSQRFYELIFSGSSILFFITVYYLINRFYTVEPYKSLFQKYDSFLLMLLIVISCIGNTLMDRVFVRLDSLKNEDRSAVRILGMVYMMVIFAYIKYIYENDNYDMYITYFLGIMVGRFVYFDASFRDFAVSIRRAAANIPFMLLALACTAGLAYYGFTTKYLIKHIGVVTNVYIAHIFLCVSVCIIYYIHPERRILKSIERDHGSAQSSVPPEEHRQGIERKD